jgi:hypothetical protein
VPLDYILDADNRLVTITGDYGTAEEWLALLDRLQKDSRLTPGFAFLRDLRAARTLVDAATVVSIMDAVRRVWPLVQPSRGAILTPHNFDVAALTAHALADSHGLPMRMFTSYDAAVEWLREGTLSGDAAPGPQKSSR